MREDATRGLYSLITESFQTRPNFRLTIVGMQSLAYELEPTQIASRAYTTLIAERRTDDEADLSIVFINWGLELFLRVIQSFMDVKVVEVNCSLRKSLARPRLSLMSAWHRWARTLLFSLKKILAALLS